MSDHHITSKVNFQDWVLGQGEFSEENLKKARDEFFTKLGKHWYELMTASVEKAFSDHDAVPEAIANAESVAPQPTAGDRSGNPTSHSGTGKQPAPPCVETDGFSSGSSSDPINRNAERESPRRECGESSLRDVARPDTKGKVAGGPGHHISDRSQPVKDDLSDRSQPIRDERPAAGIRDAAPRLRQMNDVLGETERLRGQLAWTERERDSLRVSINNLRDYVAELNAELYAKSDEKCVSYDTNHDAAPAARASAGNTHRSVEESSRPRRAHNPEIAGANPAAPTLDAALEAIADLPDERPPNAVSANGGTPSAASRDGSGTSNTHKPVAWARFYSNGGPESFYWDRPPADAVPLYRHPAPPQGSVQGEGSFRDSQNAKEPVAWAVETGGELEASFCGPAGREDADDWREQSDGVIVPLYRHPAEPCPHVTGKTTRYCTLTPFTITDEEREAVDRQAKWLVSQAKNKQDIHSADLLLQEAATLRGLLERLGGGR